MTYTGEVDPGRPRRDPRGRRPAITKVAVDPEMSNNCYLLRCVSTGDQVLIDAAAEPETLLPLIGDAGLTHVVTTHQHWDHHRALADVVAATGAEVVAGAPDAEAITEQTGVARDPHRRRRRHRPGRRLLARGDPPRPATRPARSPCSTTTGRGSPHLFTGDSLFPGGVGNTRGDSRQLPLAHRRRRDQALRRPPRRDLVLPRPRQRLDPRRRAPALAEWRERGW